MTPEEYARLRAETVRRWARVIDRHEELGEHGKANEARRDLHRELIEIERKRDEA